MKIRRDVRGGYSALELCERISRIYEIAPSRRFRTQVERALERGVDYGLLRKTRDNKYRYEAPPPPPPPLDKAAKPRKTRRQQPSNRKKPGKKRAGKSGVMKASSSGKSSKGLEEQGDGDKARQAVPRPTVPPPPDWKQKPRDLLNEPLSKVIKK